jgi:hypothetical protein
VLPFPDFFEDEDEDENEDEDEYEEGGSSVRQ